MRVGMRELLPAAQHRRQRANHQDNEDRIYNDALSRDWDSSIRPSASEKVVVDFPFATGVGRCTAHVVEWPPPRAAEAADVSVLELDHEIRLRSYSTATDRSWNGQSFQAMGFPAGQDGGMDASGTLGPAREFGRLIAHGNSLPGFFISGGFSGSPLLDRDTRVVIGMAAEAARDETRRTAIVIPSEQLSSVWPPLARPYKGLAPFEESDARFFFGRGRYIVDLSDKLKRRSLVTVVGRSGSGESSLVRAGLIPRLRASGVWRVITFRPGAPAPDNPIYNLAAAILEEMEGAVVDGAGIVSRHEKLAQWLGNLKRHRRQ
jgi:hypothetical protein